MRLRLRLRHWIAAVSAAAIIAAGIAIGTKHPAHGQTTTTSLPVGTSFAVTNGAVVAIGPTNPSRRTFTICNGAAGSLIYVMPSTSAAPTTTSGIPIASNACLSPPQNLVQSGTAAGGGAGWNAIASGATAQVGFIEW